jgi:hypothetical protein
MINTDIDIEVLTLFNLVFLMLAVFGPARFDGLFTTLWALTVLAEAIDRMLRQDDYFDNPWNYLALALGLGLLHAGVQRLRKRHTMTGSFVGDVPKY